MRFTLYFRLKGGMETLSHQKTLKNGIVTFCCLKETLMLVLAGTALFNKEIDADFVHLSANKGNCERLRRAIHLNISNFFKI